MNMDGLICLTDDPAFRRRYGAAPAICAECPKHRTDPECHKRQWFVVEPIGYLLPGVFKLEVLPWACTDFASIPQLAHSVIGDPADKKYIRGSVFHDDCYSTGAVVEREDADHGLRQLINNDGANWIERETITDCVRTFGSVVWNAHTEEEREFFSHTHKIVWLDGREVTQRVA